MLTIGNLRKQDLESELIKLRLQKGENKKTILKLSKKIEKSKDDTKQLRISNWELKSEVEQLHEAHSIASQRLVDFEKDIKKFSFLVTKMEKVYEAAESITNCARNHSVDNSEQHGQIRSIFNQIEKFEKQSREGNGIKQETMFAFYKGKEFRKLEFFTEKILGALLRLFNQIEQNTYQTTLGRLLD